MITTASTNDTIAIPAHALTAIFSNHTHCLACRSGEIRVHFCPGCREVSGSHCRRLS